MFSRKQDAIEAMNKYVVVSLYTDGPTELDEEHGKLREQLTGSVTNPVYVLRDPFDGKVMTVLDYNQAMRDDFAKKVEKGRRRFDSRQRRRGH